MKDDGENVEFFRGLVEWSEGDTCFFTNYWTWAEHTGDAIERFRTYARSIGIDDLFIMGIEPFDHEALPEETISGDNNIFVSDTAHGAPTEQTFRLPYGVALSLEKGPHDSDQFAVGHSIEEDDDGLIELAAVVEEQSLLSFYIRLVEELPEVK